jgi:uncharacterized protein
MSEDATLESLCEAGDAEALYAYLKQHPESANNPDGARVSPLMQALYRGRRNIADVLIQHGWVVDAFEAAAMNLPDALKAALDSNPAALNAVSPDGFTALHFSVFFQAPAAMEALLALKPDLEIVSQNGLAVTPLQSALAASNVSGAMALITAGADLEASASQGWRPIHYCAAHNLPEVARELLQRGADRNTVTPDGKTALQLAEEAGAHEVLALLASA